jgi:hypothetical protein
MSSLQYVQINENIAVIDSRVYCQNILEVNHSDWLQNVIYKHQEAIENRFGFLRFQNGYVDLPNQGKRETKYVLLTESQCNALLVLSRNSKKVLEKKLDLVVDFELAKQQIRDNLENLFKQEASDRDELVKALNNAESELLTLQQKLHQSQLDHQSFCFTARFLHQVSGIVNFSQVKSAIKRDFVEGRDWILVENEIYLNESTFNILTVSFRSLRGTNISCLPEIIKLETQLYFQYQEQRRKNRRINQCDCDGQIALNLEVQ